MNLKLLIWGLIFSLLPGLILAKDNSLDRYYKNLFLGEKRTVNYSGPLDARAIFSEETGSLLLLDDIYANHYINQQIQADAMELHQFWFKKVTEKSTCPDDTLGENIDYIRYLYRLLSVSYLFESIRVNNKAVRELGADKKVCSLNFIDIFGSCKPASDDMKKFHERVYGKFQNEISRINVQSLSKKETAQWFEDFQKSTSLTTNPVFARLHDWCHQNKKNCRNLNNQEIKDALSGFCSEDKKLIENLCSEKDSLYGLSYAEKATELIQSSNAFNVINYSGMGEDCLRRFVKIFAPKEIRYGDLGKQFPLIYSQLLKDKSRYLQGELFLPGALKEFDMKGLSDFLTALKPPKLEPKKVVKPAPRPKPKPIVVVEKPVEIPKPIPVPVEVVIEPPKPKISEFESVLMEIDEKNLASLSLNMDRFREDFEFSNQMITELATPIKKFQTRAALTDMKSYDNLGSTDAPVGLIFLKYLIDTDNHQGLYNIITVLGDKFYVINDIEKKERPVLVELKNDSSTRNRWQIILMKKPAKK